MAVVGRVWDQDQGGWDQVRGDMLHRCYSANVGREFVLTYHETADDHQCLEDKRQLGRTAAFSTSSEGYELSVRSTS